MGTSRRWRAESTWSDGSSHVTSRETLTEQSGQHAPPHGQASCACIVYACGVFMMGSRPSRWAMYSSVWTCGARVSRPRAGREAAPRC